MFNDEINKEVLEVAITQSNLNLLKYASDLGLVKINITDNCFKKACEKGDLKVIKHLVGVFQTIDFEGNTYNSINFGVLYESFCSFHWIDWGLETKY